MRPSFGIADYLGKRQFEKSLFYNTIGKRILIWNVHSLEKTVFLFVFVDEFQLAGKKGKNPIWKIVMKDVHLGKPTSFLDHVFLGVALNEN